MRKVNLCCIVKDEGKYIEEWIEYHLQKGVSHFYIYDHGSMDSTRTFLNRYSTLGLVTVIEWGHIPVPAQKLAYAHCLFQVLSKSERDNWIGFLDCDEFVECEGDLIDNLEVVSDELTGVVVCNWKLFGSSGYIKAPQGGVLQNFIYCQTGYNQHVKCFVIPNRCEGPGADAHTFRTRLNIVSSTGQLCEPNTPFHPVLGDPLILIHHYHTKSQEEYKTRCLRGRVDMIQKKTFEENFQEHDRNEAQDTSLVKYSTLIRERIKNRPWNINLHDLKLGSLPDSLDGGKDSLE